jgi:hypothetical protein
VPGCFSGRVVRNCRGTQIDSRYLPIGGFGGLGGNGSGGGVGVGLGGVGLGGDGVSCMIQSRFMSSEVETSLTLFLSWRDKQSEPSTPLARCFLAVNPIPTGSC